MRLIDANAFILDQMKVARISDTEWQMAYWAGVDETIGDVGEAPTIDAVPVKHGRWLSLTECANAGVYCSVCNKKVYKEDYAWCNRRNKMRSNYCPNCGAKMDLEEMDNGID